MNKGKFEITLPTKDQALDFKMMLKARGSVVTLPEIGQIRGERVYRSFVRGRTVTGYFKTM